MQLDDSLKARYLCLQFLIGVFKGGRSVAQILQKKSQILDHKNSKNLSMMCFNQTEKISKYKTFDKNYLLLKLSEYDITIINKSFIEKTIITS